MTNGPDLAQRRAKHALGAVTAYRDAKYRDDEERKKSHSAYASYIKSAPAAIVMNGLGQMLASELDQGSKDSAKGQGGVKPHAHRQIFLHLQDWLCGDDPEAVFRSAKGDNTRLLTQLYGANQPEYLRAQAEALLYLGWLKKFAGALLADDGEDR